MVANELVLVVVVDVVALDRAFEVMTVNVDVVVVVVVSVIVIFNVAAAAVVVVIISNNERRREISIRD